MNPLIKSVVYERGGGGPRFAHRLPRYLLHACAGGTPPAGTAPATATTTAIPIRRTWGFSWRTGAKAARSRRPGRTGLHLPLRGLAAQTADQRLRIALGSQHGCFRCVVGHVSVSDYLTRPAQRDEGERVFVVSKHSAWFRRITRVAMSMAWRSVSSPSSTSAVNARVNHCRHWAA
jgi:hypothetical protein